MTDKPDWQQRVIDERSQLHERLLKLRDFQLSEPFKALNNEDQILLIGQSAAMHEYHEILNERIARFS